MQSENATGQVLKIRIFGTGDTNAIALEYADARGFRIGGEIRVREEYRDGQLRSKPGVRGRFLGSILRN